MKLLNSVYHLLLRQTHHFDSELIDDVIRVETKNDMIQKLLSDERFTQLLLKQHLMLKHTHLARANYYLYFTYRDIYEVSSVVDYHYCECSYCEKAKLRWGDSK